jgi:hypothetical protein
MSQNKEDTRADPVKRSTYIDAPHPGGFRKAFGRGCKKLWPRTKGLRKEEAIKLPSGLKNTFLRRNK